jgi:myosin heavy subunit
MAILCTLETNSIWTSILQALESDKVESLEKVQAKSKHNIVVTAPLTIAELKDLCATTDDIKIFVFFNPPSLVFSSNNSRKLDLEKVVLERTKNFEELLDIHYKFKSKVFLINSTVIFDYSNREAVAKEISLDLDKIKFELSYEEVLSYLAFNHRIEKAYKIEKLLNGVSHLGACSLKSLVSLTCSKLDSQRELLKNELEKSKYESSKLREELTSKSEEFDSGSKDLTNIRKKYKVLEKESSLERERLELTVYTLQARLEESVKTHKSEVQKTISSNKQKLKNASIEYERKIDELDNKIALLSEKLSESTKVCDSFTKRNAALEARNKSLEETLFITQEALENFAKAANAETQLLSDKVQKLTMTCENETRKREQAEAQIVKLKDDHEGRLKSSEADRASEIKQLSSSWKSEKLEIEKNAGLRISKKNKELVTLKVTSDRIIDKLESENKKLQKELKTYQALYYQIKNDFDAVKSSTTWKTLSPVLKVKDKVLGKGQKFDQDELVTNIGLLYTSDLFDAEWYLATYKDVAKQGLDPAKHYLLHGFKEGRRPSLNFDGDWYFNYYEDVKAAGFNPLVHFIRYGKAEGRKTSHNLLMNLNR